MRVIPVGSLHSSAQCNNAHSSLPGAAGRPFGENDMKDEKYLKAFLPAEVYKDYQANVPECPPECHPESLFNSDEDRMFCGLTVAIEDAAERIGSEVFEAIGHTAAEAREFYDQGALDDVAAWMAAEIVRRRYKNFDEVRGFIRGRALVDVSDAMLREALDD